MQESIFAKWIQMTLIQWCDIQWKYSEIIDLFIMYSTAAVDYVLELICMAGIKNRNNFNNK